MTFRLSTKSQTFAIQQLLYWYIKCKKGSSKTSLSLLYGFFLPLWLSASLVPFFFSSVRSLDPDVFSFTGFKSIIIS